MSKLKVLGAWLWSAFTFAAVAAICYGTVVGYGYMSAKFKANVEPPKKNPVPVESLIVTPKTVSQRIMFNATILPFFSVSIQPKIGGRLESLQTPSGRELTEGLQINAGDVIAELDKAQLEADVNFQKAALESVKANVELAKVNLSENRREMERQELLTQREAGTSQEYDKSKTAYERSIAQLRQALNSVTQQEAALKQAQVKLSDATIFAPQTGVITKKHLHPGSYVSTNTPIVDMMSVDTVKIEIKVPQNYLVHLREGQTEVELESENWERPYVGTVTEIFPAIDEVTHTCAIRIHMKNVFENENGGMRYRPGMYLTASIVLQTHENVPAVPMDLLVRNSGKYYLFKTSKDDPNRVQATEVVLGIRDGQYAEIVSGISCGDEVISNGQFRLTDGERIIRLNAKDAAK